MGQFNYLSRELICYLESNFLYLSKVDRDSHCGIGLESKQFLFPLFSVLVSSLEEKHHVLHSSTSWREGNSRVSPLL